MNKSNLTFLQIKNKLYLIFPLTAIFLVALKLPLILLILLPYIYFARKIISYKLVFFVLLFFGLVFLLNYLLFSFPYFGSYYYCFQKSGDTTYLTNGFTRLAVYAESDIQVGDFIKIDSRFYFAREVDLNQFSKQIAGHYYIRHSTYALSLKYFYYSYYLSKYLAIFPENIKTWLSTFLLADQTPDLETRRLISGYGLTSVISASGLFTAFLITLIKKIFNYFSVSGKKQLIFLTVFLFWLHFSNPKASSFKFAFIYLIYLTANLKKIKISKINALSLTGLFAFVLNPFSVFNYGFVLTYLISFFSILNKINFKWQRGYLKAKIKSSIYFYLIIFPLSVNFGGKLNLVTLFLSSFILQFLTYFYFPLIIILLFFYPLAYALEYPYRAILTIFKQSKENFLELSFPEFSPYLLALYYLLLIFLVFRKTTFIYLKKCIFLLALILFKTRFLLAPLPYLKTVQESNTTSMILISNAKATLINPASKTLSKFKKLGFVFEPEVIYTDLFYFEKELFTLNEIKPSKLYFTKLPKTVLDNYYFLPNNFQIGEFELNLLYTTKTYEHSSNRGPVLELKHQSVSLLFLNSTTHSKLSLFFSEHKDLKPTHIFARPNSAVTEPYFQNKLRYVKNIATTKTINTYFLTKNSVFRYSDKYMFLQKL